MRINKRTIARNLSLAGISFMIPMLSIAAASVWTMRYDNSRSSTFLSEKLLTTSNVNTANFGKLFTLASDDQIYTTPLYIADLNIAGGTHNVVFFASVKNTVYAYDADNGALLWSKSLNNGFRPFNRDDARAFGACGGGYSDAAANMGIIGTPVIDVKTKTLYVVAKTVENGSYPQRLHALDLTNGAEKSGGPVVLSGSVNGTGDGGTTVTFNSRIQNQRAGLALVNNIVYIAQSSYCDSGQYHGWVFGYNASNLSQVALWNAAPDSFRAGIWHAGQAPAADGSGNLLFATGNGANSNGSNGTRNFGESVVKLAQNGTGGLSVADFWTPGNWAALDNADADQGSAGVLLLPGRTRIVQGGKDGVLHLFNTANLTGLGGSGSQQFQATFSQNGGPKHIHGAPIYWNGPNSGMLYAWGEDDYLRTFQFNGTTFNTSAYRTGTVIAPQIGQGMPGAFLSLSARGNQAGTGVLWANAIYDGDANQATRPGILRAYDATNAVNELWNNHQTAGDDCGYFAKGTHPVAINSKVYLASFGVGSTTTGGQVCVYGLKTGPAQPAGGVPAYPAGFSGATQFAYNGSAFLNGNSIRLTDGRPNQAASVFYLHAVPVDQFHTAFSFQIGAGTNIADGMTFSIQNTSPYALGGPGGGLGFGVDPGAGASPATGIPRSVAVKFDVYNNAGEGTTSTGLFTNGVAPTVPATALPTTIDLRSGHQFNVTMAYDGATLTVTIKDATTGASATQTYTVNIPSVVGSSSAYVGFTGGSGGLVATQDVLNWTFTNP